VVESLIELAGEAGISLTHLAMAFVLEHPAVSSAIIGPRTMEQLTDVLDGAGTRLSDEVLDRIDELVPPGTNLNRADTGWEPASLRRSQRRRPRRPGG
jgi:aryl-alcohol dehydrogenase-like predicted oxidoreductase